MIDRQMKARADKGFPIEDKLLTCIDCGRDFVFTAGETRFYLSKGLTLYPKRCPECRRKRRLTINREGNQYKNIYEILREAREEIRRW